MKLVKKITFKRAKILPAFKEIEQKFIDIKDKEKNKGVARLKNISELSFYIVVEYINLADKINYSKIFPNDNFVVDFEALINEQEKIMDYMNKKKNGNYPILFKKLGLTNDVTGCFLIATRKNIEFISKKNTFNTITARLNLKNIPHEVETLCEEFYKNKQEAIKKEQAEFEKFMSLSFEEQDIILQNILKNVQLPTTSFFIPTAIVVADTGTTIFNSHKPMKIEDVALQNVENINSIEFLSSLLSISEDKERYELCAKIRDRIIFLKEKQKKV